MAAVVVVAVSEWGGALLSIHATPPAASNSVASPSFAVLLLRRLVVFWRGGVPADAMVGVVSPRYWVGGYVYAGASSAW